MSAGGVFNGERGVKSVVISGGDKGTSITGIASSEVGSCRGLVKMSKVRFI